MKIQKISIDELITLFRYDNLQYKVRALTETEVEVQAIEPSFRMILGHYLVEVDMKFTPLKDIYMQWKDQHVIYSFQRVDDHHAEVSIHDLDGNLLKLYHIELRS